ncbi:MAG: hypothetical protein WAZ14_03500 [Patescibacteria group bacterium]
MVKNFVAQVGVNQVDVRCPADAPSLLSVLAVSNGDQELLLEVVAYLGGGLVRTLPLGSTTGLQRGLEVRFVSKSLSVPVGHELLGRRINALGKPLDGMAPVQTKQFAVSRGVAPKLAEVVSPTKIFRTGVGVIDLLFPIPEGGLVALQSKTGVSALFTQVLRASEAKCVYVLTNARSKQVAEVMTTLEQAQVIAKAVVVTSGVGEVTALHNQAVDTALTVAESLRSVAGVSLWLDSAAGLSAAAMERMVSTAAGPLTTFLLGAPLASLATDVVTVVHFDGESSELVDIKSSHSHWLTAKQVGAEHFEVANQVLEILRMSVQMKVGERAPDPAVIAKADRLWSYLRESRVEISETEAYISQLVSRCRAVLAGE